MRIQAVIFDVYATLLRVGPPPQDADAQWTALSQECFQSPPSLSRLKFSVACNQAIARRHKAAHARGIPFPEVLWPGVVAEVLPLFKRLPAAAQADFIYRQMQLGRTIALQEGAAAVLSLLRDQGRSLGIASNSQAYTLRELGEALDGVGLGMNLFARDLCLWSFEQGFSKPDPHIFQTLTARLEARGVMAPEILMVGDRLDNDVLPARRHGWQTWQITPPGGAGPAAGDWRALQAWLCRAAQR